MSELPLSGPLAGLVVLDVSSFIAAPAAAVALADFGADVIKIEPPGDGDPHRNSFRNASYPPSDKNFPWQLDGRLKRSLALDLKNEKRAARARAIDRARRRHDRELPAAGARAPEAVLGRHRAHQPAPGLLLAHRLRRDRARSRPAGLRRHRLFRPLRHFGRRTLRGRPAGPFAAGARRSRDGDDAGRRHPARPAPARPHRQGLLGRHVALCQRRMGQRHLGRRRAGRRASAAATVTRQAAQCADQPLPHQGRSLAAAPAGARRPPVAGPVQGDRAAGSCRRPALHPTRRPPRRDRWSW